MQQVDHLTTSRQGITITHAGTTATYNNRSQATAGTAAMNANRSHEYRNEQQMLNDPHATFNLNQTGMLSDNAGTTPSTLLQNQAMNMDISTGGITITLPALLPGSRCYTDASTLPDQIAPLSLKRAGLGIL